jgi:hypothetical protein
MNTEFDELLRDGMERFTADLRAPVNLAARASRHRKQRLTVRTAASGVAAMTVAGITFAALPATTAPVSTGITRHHPVTERLDLERIRVSQVDKIAVEAWVYQERLRVLRTRSGHPTEDEGSITVKVKKGLSRSTTTIVDYPRKEWARGASDEYLITPTLYCHLPSIFIPYSAGALLGWIRGAHKLIKCGALIVSGTARINGIPTIKLETSASFVSPPIKHATIWVKRSDYAPVRMVEDMTSGTVRTDVSWLPPTKANLAMLRVPIPPGFRKVPISQLAPTKSETCRSGSSHPHKQTCTKSR